MVLWNFPLLGVDLTLKHRLSMIDVYSPVQCRFLFGVSKMLPFDVAMLPVSTDFSASQCWKSNYIFSVSVISVPRWDSPGNLMAPRWRVNCEATILFNFNLKSLSLNLNLAPDVYRDDLRCVSVCFVSIRPIFLRLECLFWYYSLRYDLWWKRIGG